MPFTFEFSNGSSISIEDETQTAKYLTLYSVYMGCLKHIEAYGLSSDYIKNGISYFQDSFFNCPDIQNLNNNKIRELQSYIYAFANEYNDNTADLLDKYFYITMLKQIEPEVKKQYIIAKVNEARERNIPDPPVEISNDPVEIF